ncbi:MAG: hypothetical protein HY979_01485, partial [Candidatus Magasanikbacteria bacterium]|nr:hypothetical protein [Candidatus Magasanikbacteria bacterium]
MLVFKTKLKIIFIGLIFLIAPFFAQASVLRFNIDPSYDFQGRSQIKSFLQQMGEKAYFYVEDDYYQTLTIEEKQTFSEAVNNLSQEFDATIYPQLIKIYGSEWKPGIDSDERIFVLLTKMKEDSAGYFNSSDEYSKTQVPISNEREMIYLNVNYITSPLNKSYLAHEFVHLITFNQKDRTYGVSEETWLNEGRAEVAPTLLGYDKDYEGSNLQKRVKTFAQNRDDSLTEWKNIASDYGVLNLFIQYLIDHYGTKILVDSLRSEKTGIPSLNAALKKAGFAEDFSQVFTDWTITVFLNDCNLGSRYCYLNQNLKNLKVLPQLNYLPLSGESTLTVTSYTKDWTGNWIKFIGAQGTLKIEFVGEQKVNFEVPYISQDSSGKYAVNFLKLDDFQQGTVYIKNFDKNYNSLTIIPSIQQKLSGFDGIESFYKFIWSISIINENSGEEELINNLLAQIEILKAEIAKLQAQINAILGNSQNSCQKIENNLYYGLTDNSEVRCLQEFLKNQGKEIYPEGLVTGNFLSLTQAAVIRFQEK